MSQGLVLHDLGDAEAGAPWRSALDARGWAGWAAPDLPGHGSAPAPRTGAYDPMAAVTLARRHLAAEHLVRPVVVGVHENAHPALILAAGAGCSAVVVVDGLHGAFRAPEEEIAAVYASLRAIASDPPATGPAPAIGLDPRTRHGYGISVSEQFLRRFWGAVDVPVLVVETPGSPTPRSERDGRLAWFGAGCDVVEVDDGSAASVVAAIASWPVLSDLA